VENLNQVGNNDRESDEEDEYQDYDNLTPWAKIVY